MEQTPHTHPLPSHLRYIAIEGVIGAGKTTFCKELAKHSDNPRLVLEKADENPFLPLFYRSGNTYAFQTQLWFLLSRYRQLASGFSQRDLFYDVTIADYLFSKDKIFANVILPQYEITLYNTVYDLLKPKVVPPDLVVYLQASTDKLMERIRHRNTPYERHIDRDYIEGLNEAYNHFFFHFSEAPLLIINTTNVDHITHPYTMNELIDQMAHIKSGTNFYQPLPQQDILKVKKRDHEGNTSENTYDEE